jgi:hypothetical protein
MWIKIGDGKLPSIRQMQDTQIDRKEAMRSAVDAARLIHVDIVFEQRSRSSLQGLASLSDEALELELLVEVHRVTDISGGQIIEQLETR